MVAACTPTPAQAPTSAPAPTKASGGTFVYGSPFEPSALNPIVAPDVVTKWILEMIFDGVVAINDKMEIIPELATSWDISPDGKIYTFKLRNDVKWHDGKSFSADDVKFTYDTIIDPKQPKTIAKSDYALVEKVEVVDPQTARFVLKSPNASFLSKLAIGIAPKHLLEGQEAATAAFNRKPIGTGAFKVDEWSAGQKVVLVAYADYFRGRAKLDKLVWQIPPDSNVLTLQMLNGEVDGGPIINPKDLPKFKEKKNLAVFESVGANTYIGFNNEKEPFNDKRVRQALNYGLDKKTIIEKIVEGQVLPSAGIESPRGSSGIADRIAHLVMPAFVISLREMGRLIRFTRASLLDALHQDYVRTAKSKGLHDYQVAMRHAFRNALIPIITLLGLALPQIASSSIIVESAHSF